jgi:sugar phosphate isomerase/epimerase
MKRRFPFRLGTTSYILQDEIVPNVRYLKDQVDFIVTASGYGICLDIGHWWHRHYDEEWLVEALLPRARSIHLHGWDEVRDHRGLHHLPAGQVRRLIDAVAAQPDADDRALSVEVFAEEQLIPSLDVLHAIA